MPGYFKKLKFQKKIFIICLIVSLIPVSVLGILCCSQVRFLLMNRERIALNDSLEQESAALNTKFDECEHAINYVIWNDNIKQMLNQNYDSNYDMYIAFRDTLDPLFTTLKSFNSNILNITLYTDISIYPHGSILRPLSEIQNNDWFPEVSSTYTPKWIESKSEKQLALLCRFYDPKSTHVSIVKFDIQYERFFSSMETLYEHSYGILLADSQGIPLYEFHSFPDKEDEYILSSKQLADTVQGTNSLKDFVVEWAPQICDDWTLYLYRPVETVSAPAHTLTVSILMIILLCLAAVIFSSLFLSRFTVRPLQKLMDNIKLVEQGNFIVTATYDSTDEIGCLMQSFGNMVRQLHHLVDEVLKSKILQQEYEMRALQTQINPHFLYNSLSLINSKAILAGENEISQMAQFLSTFYRTTLNKGKNIISIEDEIKNISSYVKIQQIMHPDSFQAIFHIEDAILPLPIINLILQPLVENAIMHGIYCRTQPGDGLLEISGYLQNGLLIFEISDNGPGLTENQLEEILTIQSQGYGIQNVNHRIQLFYGSQYGLSYQNRKEGGLTATLTLPLKFPQHPTL